MLIRGLFTTRKYQFMELNLQRRVSGLKDKMPDIQKTLDTVRFLKTRTVRTTDRCPLPPRPVHTKHVREDQQHEEDKHKQGWMDGWLTGGRLYGCTG